MEFLDLDSQRKRVERRIAKLSQRVSLSRVEQEELIKLKDFALKLKTLKNDEIREETLKNQKDHLVNKELDLEINILDFLLRLKKKRREEFDDRNKKSLQELEKNDIFEVVDFSRLFKSKAFIIIFISILIVAFLYKIFV